MVKRLEHYFFPFASGAEYHRGEAPLFVDETFSSPNHRLWPDSFVVGGRAEVSLIPDLDQVRRHEIWSRRAREQAHSNQFFLHPFSGYSDEPMVVSDTMSGFLAVALVLGALGLVSHSFRHPIGREEFRFVYGDPLRPTRRLVVEEDINAVLNFLREDVARQENATLVNGHERVWLMQEMACYFDGSRDLIVGSPTSLADFRKTIQTRSEAIITVLDAEIVAYETILSREGVPFDPSCSWEQHQSLLVQERFFQEGSQGEGFLSVRQRNFLREYHLRLVERELWQFWKHHFSADTWSPSVAMN